MTHETVVLISQLLAFVIFLGLFAGVVFYAFRPRNKSLFKRASELPLDRSGNDRPGDRNHG